MSPLLRSSVLGRRATCRNTGVTKSAVPKSGTQRPPPSRWCLTHRVTHVPGERLISAGVCCSQGPVPNAGRDSVLQRTLECGHPQPGQVERRQASVHRTSSWVPRGLSHSMEVPGHSADEAALSRLQLLLLHLLSTEMTVLHGCQPWRKVATCC